MPYATTTDLLKEITQEELLELADDTQVGYLTEATVAAVIADAIADADALIDSYAAQRYTVPFNPVPAAVVRICTVCALYNLYLRRQAVPTHREAAYNGAVRWLEHLAKGLVTLGAQEISAAPTTAVGGPQTTSDPSDRLFTLDQPSQGMVGTLRNY